MMKKSLDYLQEYVKKHEPAGHKAMAEFLGVTMSHISGWKKNGGMPSAATVKVGLELGYDLIEVLETVAVESERTQEGKRFLLELAGYDKPASQFGGKGRF